MYLCFDLGGTDIKAGIIDEQGKIKAQQKVPTKVAAGVEGILQQFKEIEQILFNSIGLDLRENVIQGVGVGIPGYVVMEEGFVIKAPNLGWENIFITEKLQKIFTCPVYVANDANAAALGEMWLGAGKNKKNLLCLTLGTGIGAGIIIDGKLHAGTQGLAGEIGHFLVNPQAGKQCNCGKSGCLETESSGRALALQGERIVKEGYDTVLAQIRAEKHIINSKDIVDAAIMGDKEAIKIIDNGAYYLGQSLANIYLVIAPEQIIIGGGLAKAGEILFKRIIHWFNYFSLPDVNIEGENVIVPAILGNDAGIIGLAKLVKTQ